MKTYKILRTILLILFASMSIFGCLDPQATLNEKQISYIGEHAQVLFDQMGFPQEERLIAGQKLYVWNYQNSTSSIIPVTNSAVASGTYSSFGDFGSYSGTTTYTTFIPMVGESRCTVRAFVNNNDIVQKFDMEGTVDGCNLLLSRM